MPDVGVWRELDAIIRTWWDDDARRATEEEIRAQKAGDSPGMALVFLPFPYLTPGGTEGSFPAMFAWDIPDFTSRALIAHNRVDLARSHILNYLFMVARFGYMPNGNIVAFLTRSQTPLLPDTLWRYYLATGDLSLLEQAYPLLKANYRDYWMAPHHRTPTGLITNRDLGDSKWSPELAAEAETGLDWTPIYGGDVRRCVPLITNCALVRYAQVLGLIGKVIGCHAEAESFEGEANGLADLIRELCWDEDAGLFVEYDYVAEEQLPYVSASSYWTLWARVATADQARRLVDNLRLLEQPYGISSTDRAYPDPHPAESYPELARKVEPHVPTEVIGGRGQLQWMYPAGWAPEQIMVVEGLDAYGYAAEAKRIATRFLTVVLEQYQQTGRLWEKYNVVDGSLVLSNSRYGNVPMRGWTAAAVVLLGRRAFLDEPLVIARS